VGERGESVRMKRSKNKNGTPGGKTKEPKKEIGDSCGANYSKGKREKKLKREEGFLNISTNF